MWADPYDLAGLGIGEGEGVVYNSGEEVPASQAAAAQQIIASRSGGDTVAVQPTTQDQIFNLVNTVAKGLLAVKQTEAQTKLSAAAAQAAAEASKVQAQNYVMQQLQQGKQVLVPQSWLQQYASSDTTTKWLTPILVIGGVALLGYALWKYSKGKAGSSGASAASTPLHGADATAAVASANPRRRRRRRHA